MVYNDLQHIELKKPQQVELDHLLNVCTNNLSSVDEKLISNAFKLCYESHKGVSRASGEPYYQHPLEVAIIVVTEMNIDDVSVAAFHGRRPAGSADQICRSTPQYAHTSTPEAR